MVEDNAYPSPDDLGHGSEDKKEKETSELINTNNLLQQQINSTSYSNNLLQQQINRVPKNPLIGGSNSSVVNEMRIYAERGDDSVCK